MEVKQSLTDGQQTLSERDSDSHQNDKTIVHCVSEDGGDIITPDREGGEDEMSEMSLDQGWNPNEQQPEISDPDEVIFVRNVGVQTSTHGNFSMAVQTEDQYGPQPNEPAHKSV